MHADFTGGTYLHASNTLRGKYLHISEYFFRIGNRKGRISVPLHTEPPQIQGQAKNASNLLPEKSSMTWSKVDSRRKALKLRVVVDRSTESLCRNHPFDKNRNFPTASPPFPRVPISIVLV
jgi:hypothetical protein